MQQINYYIFVFYYGYLNEEVLGFYERIAHNAGEAANTYVNVMRCGAQDFVVEVEDNYGCFTYLEAAIRASSGITDELGVHTLKTCDHLGPSYLIQFMRDNREAMECKSRL